MKIKKEYHYDLKFEVFEDKANGYVKIDRAI